MLRKLITINHLQESVRPDDLRHGHREFPSGRCHRAEHHPGEHLASHHD